MHDGQRGARVAVEDHGFDGAARRLGLGAVGGASGSERLPSPPPRAEGAERIEEAEHLAGEDRAREAGCAPRAAFCQILASQRNCGGSQIGSPSVMTASWKPGRGHRLRELRRGVAVRIGEGPGGTAERPLDRGPRLGDLGQRLCGLDAGEDRVGDPMGPISTPAAAISATRGQSRRRGASPSARPT